MMHELPMEGQAGKRINNRKQVDWAAETDYA